MVLAVNGTSPAPSTTDSGISISTQEWYITPERAQQLLTEHPYARQRTLKRRQVQNLTNAMLGGTFLPDAISVVRYQGEDILVNGQHRMHAIIASGCAFTFPVTVYRVSSEAEINTVYGRLDRGTARSVGDVLRAHDVAADLDLPPHFVERIGSAFPLIEMAWSNRSRQLSLARDADSRVQALYEWQTELHTYHSLLVGVIGSKQDYGRMILAGVSSVALFTLRHAGPFAEDFWRSIAINDGLRKGTPNRTLVDWVDRQRLVTTRGGNNGAYIARGCITAWNAAYRARDLTMIRIMDAAAPVTILGTPMRDGVLR